MYEENRIENEGFWILKLNLESEKKGHYKILGKKYKKMIQ